MKKYLVGIIIALNIICGMALASDVRAWVATKSHGNILIIGETHFGTQLELDRFYNEIIRPYALNSDAILAESVDGSSLPGLCKDIQYRNNNFWMFSDLDFLNELSTTISLLKDAGIEDGSILRDVIREDGHSDKKQYFGTFMHLVIGGKLSEALTQYKDYFPPVPGISARILNERFHLSSHAVNDSQKWFVGLDTIKSIDDILCNAKDADYLNFVKAYLAKMGVESKVLVALKNNEIEMGFMNRYISERYIFYMNCAASSVSCKLGDVRGQDSVSSQETNKISDSQLIYEDGPEIYHFMVELRNLSWIEKVNQAEVNFPLTFMSVGAAHLPDVSFNGKIKKGLISMLRDDGFTLKEVLFSPEFTESEIKALYKSVTTIH
ncbi:hypothetical protein KSF73_08200 [Burkholderiaceae bacterium DAT-1]|nr:hypothetical protein [Burkholderiaceae bacterium DAT-1]